MKTTNFDSSSTGLNIELSICRDSDSAQRDFKECFDIVQSESHRRHTIAVYKDYGNISPDFDFDDPVNYDFTKQDLICGLKNLDLYNNNTAFYWGFSSVHKMNKSELIEFAKIANQSDWADFLACIGTPNFVAIKTRGYCQGDYAEVIFPKKVIDYLERECLKPFDQLLPSLQTTVDHLFWDCPIYARLTVNDEEYYWDELLLDLYDFDKDHMIAQFKQVYANKFNAKDLQIVVDFLSENVPEYPDYQ